MLQTGIVRKADASCAVVEITRSSACGESCASCRLCPGGSTEVEAYNEINASVGDAVIISLSDRKVLGAAFLVYIVPLLLLIAGYFLGSFLFKTEAGGIGTGFLLTALSFAAIIYADKKIKRRFTPRIVALNKEIGH